MTSVYDSLPVSYGTGEVLEDKATDWRKNKLRTNAVAAVMKDSDKYWKGRSQRMYECGSSLQFAVSKTGEMRLYRADFCRDRMCPSCQKRRSLVVFHQVKNVCQAIQNDNPTFKYLLLTLTVPNVKADQLSDEIKHLAQSWKRLTLRADFKKSIKGWFRALEVTYNGERNDYHPHFHVLLCVPSGYFKKNYIKQERWLELWQECTRYPNITQVDVRAVKPNKKRADSDAISSAAAEVGKYATKPSNYIARLPDGDYMAVKHVVRELSMGIARKRLVAFGGIMKEYHSKLQLDDVESDSADLINVEGDKAAIDAVMIKVFRWNVGFSNYIG
jgi:plasmid rolling circle replication initiator protein Rep